MEAEDIAEHINTITQREFTFEGEPFRSHIDDSYLEIIRDSYFGPVYSYFTGLDEEKETWEFWEFYYDRKANRATASSARNYKGSDMREIRSSRGCKVGGIF